MATTDPQRRVIRPPLLRAWAGPLIVAALVTIFNPSWTATFIICVAYAIGYENGRRGTADRLLGIDPHL